MFFFRRKEHPDDPPNVRLMKSIKFGGKDLTANRSGVLTDAQRKKIHRGQMWGAVVWWSLAIVLTLPVIVMAAQDNITSKPDVWLLLLGALGCVAGAFWQQSKTRDVLTRGQTSSVSGVLSRKIDMVYTGKVFIPVHKITVDEKTFTVEDGVYNSFIEGEVYTLYYIPETDQLMSAELSYNSDKEKRLSDEPEDALDDLNALEAVSEENQDYQSLSY